MTFSLWMYPPDGNGGWHPPRLLWHHPDPAELHRQARVMRQTWDGHLFAVRPKGQQPNHARVQTQP